MSANRKHKDSWIVQIKDVEIEIIATSVSYSSIHCHGNEQRRDISGVTKKMTSVHIKVSSIVITPL